MSSRHLLSSQNLKVPLLRTDVFQFSPDYGLALVDDLSDSELLSLGKLTHDADLYGVVRPVNETGQRIAIDHTTALLLLTLREPRVLPDYVWQAEDSAKNLAQIERLLLEGVLQVRKDGSFIGGGALAVRCDKEQTAEGFLPNLSIRALQQTLALGLDEVGELSVQLYSFPRIPWSNRWSRRLEIGVLGYLGLEEGGSGLLVSRKWQRSGDLEGPWLSWRLRTMRNRGTRRPSMERHSFKLYVSPRPEALPIVFASLLEALEDSTAVGFKVGNSGVGILRPDKLVVYFDSLEGLYECAERLAPLLEGTAVHGVPFSAPITSEGLLSWGIDPPIREALTAESRESWRMWVASRLAAALLVAGKHPSDDMPTWRFALERLRRDGFDVDSWTPSPRLWGSPRLQVA